MAYTTQTWTDNNASYPLSAARMSHIEDGIAAVDRLAGVGVVALDSFSGSTDDAKFSAALSYAGAQSRIPAIQFPARSVTLSTTRNPFSGMKLIGPPGAGGPKNLEQGSGTYVNHRVLLNVGSGTSSWMYGTSQIFDVYVADLAFQGGSGAQFWHQPTNTLYACQFHALTHFGFKHVFGQPTAKCAITGCVFSGHWQTISGSDTQYSLGGSDSALWRGGQLNFGNSATGGNGRYNMIIDSLGKTSLGYVYFTNWNGWRGLQVKGSLTNVTFFGGSCEGLNANNPNSGNAVRLEGGILTMYAPWLAYSMSSPSGSEHGVVEVTGGNLYLDRPVYGRGNTANSVPLLYVSGGTAQINGAVTPSGEKPTVTRTGSGVLISDSSVNVV